MKPDSARQKALRLTERLSGVSSLGLSRGGRWVVASNLGPLFLGELLVLLDQVPRPFGEVVTVGVDLKQVPAAAASAGQIPPDLVGEGITARRLLEGVAAQHGAGTFEPFRVERRSVKISGHGSPRERRSNAAAPAGVVQE